jgi:predicted ferric reductase
VYIKHHQIGAISFVLLLFHPLFLAVKYGQSSWQLAAQFLLPSSNLAAVFGQASLVLMILLLAITFYTKLPYQIWKLSHKFLGLAYLLATLHLIFVYSDTSQSMLLKGYMLAISVAALVAAFYRSVLSSWLVPIKKYKVLAVKQINGSVNEVVLKPTGESIQHMAGQFVFISFEQKGFEEAHPFTISSAEGDLTITIKNLGNYTAQIGQLKPGTLAKVEGPFGKFTYMNSINKKQVWLAGGIGITPFLSMARSLGESSDYEIDLIYCAKNASEIVFINELNVIAGSRPWFRVHPFCSDDSGRISAQKINQLVGGLKDRDFYMCGPAPMMGSIKQQLREYNISKDVVHSEEFAMV